MGALGSLAQALAISSTEKGDLTRLSIEELASLHVVTVSRKTEARIEAPGEPFVIAVVGDDPFGATLDEVLAGKWVRGQPVRVRRFAGPAQLDGARVRILFVGRGGHEHARRVFRPWPDSRCSPSESHRGSRR